MTVGVASFFADDRATTGAAPFFADDLVTGGVYELSCADFLGVIKECRFGLVGEYELRLFTEDGRLDTVFFSLAVKCENEFYTAK